MAESTYISKGISTRDYSFNQRDLTDEITNTIEWLHVNEGTLQISTISAYVSLLYNLVSLVEDINEKRHLYTALSDLENKDKLQIRLHL